MTEIAGYPRFGVLDFPQQCLFFRYSFLFLSNKSEHRGTSSPQSEFGYIVPGSLCAFSGAPRPKSATLRRSYGAMREASRSLDRNLALPSGQGPGCPPSGGVAF